MTVTPEIAVAWIREKESIAASMNFHFGLTGSVLFKGASEKDFDVIAYPHDPHKPFDKAALLKAFGLHMTKETQSIFEMFADKYYGRNVAICTDPQSGMRIDILFMQ